MIRLAVPTEGNYGWAVCGANLARCLPDAAVEPVTEYPTETRDAVLQAVEGATFFPHNIKLWSSKANIGLAFIEHMIEADKWKANARRFFDVILGGSTWCTQRLREMGLNADTLIQGVDSAIFYPRSQPADRQKFMIFSGGKAEYRKGTDVVIRAFKVFSERHVDAHLVCSWWNPWPATVDTLAQSNLITYVPTEGDWRSKMQATMAVNGIASDRYTLLDMMGHREMPEVYSRCDVGLFPNRCEAGTNMVLVEAMACGLPVIATPTTGHADVIKKANSFSIHTRIRPESQWGEPDLDDVIYKMESAYQFRQSSHLRNIGKLGMLTATSFTWEAAASKIFQVCM